ncbi:hypothetical protein CU044_6131 [Streptomyces sp. L-9-10]|uniref:hypothetical protein n=1 Tax=Streptomyces sp. L-9-10 TaxID=1478131 RepID=UPI0010E15E25|nr:hypothetical protein [Streptomyces sp. L-9-10]RYJ21747.1 hypothetical protein CU044_6131 [Streptomyces sp. L-9-10]
MREKSRSPPSEPPVDRSGIPAGFDRRAHSSRPTPGTGLTLTRAGHVIHYDRSWTAKGQLLDRQIHALTGAGCIRIFSDKRSDEKSGKNAEREEFSIAKLLGVSRNTIYNYVPELKGGILALAEPTRAAAPPHSVQSAE